MGEWAESGRQCDGWVSNSLPPPPLRAPGRRRGVRRLDKTGIGPELAWHMVGCSALTALMVTAKIGDDEGDGARNSGGGYNGAGIIATTIGGVNYWYMHKK